MVHVSKYTIHACYLRMMELHIINILGVEKSSGTSIAGSLFFPEIHIPFFWGQHIFVWTPNRETVDTTRSK